MEKVRQKVAYLRGLLEGTDLAQADGKTRVVWNSVLDIFSELADSIEDIQGYQEEVADYVDSLGMDVEELQLDLYGEEEEEEEDQDAEESDGPIGREEGEGNVDYDADSNGGSSDNGGSAAEDEGEESSARSRHGLSGRRDGG